MKKIIIPLGVIIIIGILLYVYRGEITKHYFKPTDTNITEGTHQGGKQPVVVAEGLNIPWELVFLPGGDMLVTERPGKLLRISDHKQVIEIQGVEHRGEGGLLGLALHPNFAQNNFIYIYLTTLDGKTLSNQVERYTLTGTTLSDRKVIVENIPGSTNHDGGRIAFGPDAMLYITTGDAGTPDNAQKTDSLAGKILRVQEDGSIPSDNPFKNAVYSYGHRNIQGLTWDTDGQLWATEHGRSGRVSGYDEINKIVKGSNYGWPFIQGDEVRRGMISPYLHSTATDTWAPAGATYLNKHIIFTGLRGESLYITNTTTPGENLKTYYRGIYGRLRSVTIGPDNMLYVLTNNRDGRGDAEAKDDRIIKIDPKILGL